MRNDQKSKAKLGLAGMVAFSAIALIMGTVFTVDEGHVGVVKRFGKAIEQVDPGIHMKVPIMDAVVEIEVRTRKNVETMNAATAEQMPVKAVTAVNWTVTKSAAIELYKQYGGLDQFEQRILDPRLRSASKAGLAEFKAEQIIQNRNAAIRRIEQLLEEETAGLPIELGDVQIEDVNLPPKYIQSIETKQTELNLAAAEKHKLERQNLEAQREVNTANARRDATKAKADGEAYKIKAEAEAQAYAILQKGKAEASAIEAKAKAIAKNNTLVEYVRAQQWNGQMPTTLMGADQSILWNMGAQQKK
ncbi:prohibitin family protein [Pleionea sp. CnH1-48]|uniref:prohibitin family protein n=1 Tax=Pleionea sp. CnH1-48 TaxID=2954494 RepID=UPI002096A36D|nr:prohibitin family protein [Pleionea sp. CnH1-48]MCO7226921.1 prohibitin family protein [Pleionea sp. CnH1-48]